MNETTPSTIEIVAQLPSTEIAVIYGEEFQDKKSGLEKDISRATELFTGATQALISGRSILELLPLVGEDAQAELQVLLNNKDVATPDQLLQIAQRQLDERLASLAELINNEAKSHLGSMLARHIPHLEPDVLFKRNLAPGNASQLSPADLDVRQIMTDADLKAIARDSYALSQNAKLKLMVASRDGMLDHLSADHPIRVEATSLWEQYNSNGQKLGINPSGYDPDTLDQHDQNILTGCHIDEIKLTTIEPSSYKVEDVIQTYTDVVSDPRAERERLNATYHEANETGSRLQRYKDTLATQTN